MLITPRINVDPTIFARGATEAQGVFLCAAGLVPRGPTQHRRLLPKVGCCIGKRWINGPCLHARMSGRSTVQGRTGFSR